MSGKVGPLPVGDVHGVKRGRLTVTKLHRSGSRPIKVLLVGGRAMLSPTGHAQVEALGARITDRLWLRTRRGVDLDMVWELRPVLQAMRGALQAWRLWRYDAIVVVAPSRPKGIPARWAARGIGRLLAPVVREAAEASHVLVVSLDGGRGHRGEGHALAGVERSERVRHLTTSQRPSVGADAIARTLLEAVDAEQQGSEAAHRRRLGQDDEQARQAALDDLQIDSEKLERRLQHVVDIARDTFESASAEITLLDHDRQWTLAASGPRRPDQPRSTSLCDRSLRQPAPTLISDTWQVPDLRGNPLIAGAAPIRFYAAHPIESLAGYRIGVLCVWDDVPHEIDESDSTALRDLALLAEAEIIGT